MAKKAVEYGNESISSLKGADRVRKRPAVIFGSDGIEGCQHSIFEILSNSIDEAREGFGREIVLTRFEDGSIEVEDHGRGIPVDYNKNEDRYNWELVFCELYAGGKYNNASAESYEYSLGLNGLGLCSTQYASEYMDVDIRRDGLRYTLHFEHGENVGGLHKEPYAKKDTGSKIKWKPDLQVFTDIDVPVAYFLDMIKRQAIVNAGVKFVFRNQAGRSFEETVFNYQDGITDHVKELAGEDALTPVQSWQAEKKVRDRADKPEYKCKINVALTFSNKISVAEYYHNSSWLEHGGAPEKAVRNAFVYQIDSYLKQTGKYNKNESKITFADVEDCLVIVISSFSSVTSYENQTKKVTFTVAKTVITVSSSISLKVGDTTMFSNYVFKTGGGSITIKKVKSSNKKIVDAAGGFLIAKKPGTAKVSALVNGKRRTITVIVGKKPAPKPKLKQLQVKVKGYKYYPDSGKTIYTTRFTNKSKSTITKVKLQFTMTINEEMTRTKTFKVNIKPGKTKTMKLNIGKLIADPSNITVKCLKFWYKS